MGCILMCGGLNAGEHCSAHQQHNNNNAGENCSAKQQHEQHAVATALVQRHHHCTMRNNIWRNPHYSCSTTSLSGNPDFHAKALLQILACLVMTSLAAIATGIAPIHQVNHRTAILFRGSACIQPTYALLMETAHSFQA